MPADLIEFLQQPLAQFIIWTTIGLMVTMIGYFIVQKFRDQSGNDQLTPNELLTNFREMNMEGDIDDAEFRTIRTVLAPQLSEFIGVSQTSDRTTPADQNEPPAELPQAEIHPKPDADGPTSTEGIVETDDEVDGEDWVKNENGGD
jgi:hypothetical protein